MQMKPGSFISFIGHPFGRLPRHSPLYHTVKAASVRTGMTSGHVGLDFVCCMEGAAGKAVERTVPDMGMTANVNNKLRRQVYERDGFRCALCDSTDVIQIHHIKPRGRGGAHHPMNMITLCWRCHSAAHGPLMMLDQYAIESDPDATTDDRIRDMMEQFELDCIQYVADYYAEQGEIWYPWDG